MHVGVAVTLLAPEDDWAGVGSFVGQRLSCVDATIMVGHKAVMSKLRQADFGCMTILDVKLESSNQGIEEEEV